MKNFVLISLSIMFFPLHYFHRSPAYSSPANSDPYDWVKDWPQLPTSFVIGNPTGIAVDRTGNIFIFHRADKKWPLLWSFSQTQIRANTILEIDDRTGQIRNEWGSDLFIMPHGLTIDKENNLWVTDLGLQQVLKFSHDGKLLMTIGEKGVAGNDSAHFNRPTDVAVARDGSFYVSDGYRNSRVVKFSSAGTYLLSWGKKGSKSGEFNLPHGITLDDKGNVYVADRENSRIQVFDPSGRFLKEWKDNSFGKIYAVRFDAARKELVAVDYVTNHLTPKGSDILIFDQDGKLKHRFGRSGSYEGPVCRYHDLAIGTDGSLYVGEILRNKLQKFQRNF